ncbi:MAG: DMT family transporter [Betaproteobacteria bacterium]
MQDDAEIHRTQSTYTGYGMAFAAAVIWGTLGIFAKFTYMYDVDPVVLVSLRSSIAFLSLLAVTAVGNPSRLRLERRDFWFFAVFGLVGVSLNYTLYFEALRRTTATTAVILLYTSPVYVTLGAAAFFGEHLTQAKVVALAVTFLGCFLVAGGYEPKSLALHPAGALFGLGAAVTYASYTLFSKQALRKYSSWTSVLYAFGFGSAFLLCFAGRRLREVAALSPSAWLLIIGLAWGPTLAAYALYVQALRYIEASHAGIVCMAEPAATALLAYAILGERMSPWQLVGAVLVLGGVSILQARAVGRGGRTAQRAPQ